MPEPLPKTRPGISAQCTVHTTTAHTAQIHQPTSTLNRVVTYIHKDPGQPGPPVKPVDPGSEADTGTTPYWLRGVVRSEQDDRQMSGITPQDYGTRWRATFRRITGDSPQCDPADHGQARQYLALVVRCLEMENEWTPSERGHLNKLRGLWQARADGLDPLFEVRGTRQGRPTAEELVRVRDLQRLQDMVEYAKHSGAGGHR